MGIYIFGMQMPKNHRHMILMSNGDITDLDGKTIAKAIEFPPHGRLGDRDGLAAKDTAEYEEAINFAIDLSTRTLFDCTHRGVQKAIKNAPTIIPAEGGDTE